MSDHPGANGVVAAGDDSLVSAIRPMFLLADSQLLFWKEGDAPFLARVRAALGERPLRAAYLGASNGDVVDFYDIFLAAMEGIGVSDCRMIPASPSDADRAFLEDADIILLAGGDAARGHRAFKASGLDERIVARYAAGAVLIGISAGAMQLGQRGWTGEGEAPFDGFRLAPMIVSVHDEPDWVGLTRMVTAVGDAGRGLGIPAGGGAVVHADLSVEPVRKALVEISMIDGVLRRAMLMAGDAGASAGAA